MRSGITYKGAAVGRVVAVVATAVGASPSGGITIGTQKFVPQPVLQRIAVFTKVIGITGASAAASLVFLGTVHAGHVLARILVAGGDGSDSQQPQYQYIQTVLHETKIVNAYLILAILLNPLNQRLRLEI